MKAKNFTLSPRLTRNRKMTLLPRTAPRSVYKLSADPSVTRTEIIPGRDLSSPGSPR
jgi:hypothetical protein